MGTKTKQITETITKAEEQFIPMYDLYPHDDYDECLHTPDNLEFINEIQKSDEIIREYDCKCGKRIQNIYTFLKTER